MNEQRVVQPHTGILFSHGKGYAGTEMKLENILDKKGRYERQGRAWVHLHGCLDQAKRDRKQINDFPLIRRTTEHFKTGSECQGRYFFCN